MKRSEILDLVPHASKVLDQILDPARGLVEPPIRAEIFGLERFAQHGRSLGDAHRAATGTPQTATFFPRLKSNVDVLYETHRYIGLHANTGYDISPAAEWLLDNFHLIEAQLKEIHEGLPRSYFKSLPILIDEPLAGLPRIYGIAWAYVAHTDGAFNEELLIRFLTAYQETREINLSEIWALPTTLRVVLVENLRRVAERVATHKAAREIANLCCDNLESMTIASLDKLLVLLQLRGVGSAFLAQMAQRLQDYKKAGDAQFLASCYQWVQRGMPDLAAYQMLQSADQAANNLTVSNAVKSLRAINNADWLSIVSRTSNLVQLLLTSAVFEAEHNATRDKTLHAIEVLAKRSGLSEMAVARVLMAKMRSALAKSNLSSTATYWLKGAGWPKLAKELGIKVSLMASWTSQHSGLRLTVYLSIFLVCSVGLVAWALPSQYPLPGGSNAPRWAYLIAAVLMLFPASEAVVALINRLISESATPEHLPRYALASGIPLAHRTIVVVPSMLTNARSAHNLAHRLELHYLANPEQHVQFAMLTDWADADTECLASDSALLANAQQLISQLNARYPQEVDPWPRFIVLHRQRVWSDSEQCWIGWERKRGKLEQLIQQLAGGVQKAFINLGAESRLATDTQYVVTLDSDTQLPPGRLRELVGVAAHPNNQPQLDRDGRALVSGYGILQPRISTPLPARRDTTLFHWLFAGQCGIDPYSAATSEVYQDIFSEGTFTGKGLLHVHTMHALLSGRLPSEQVLSHDLIEGAMVRCAAVTDITVIEEAPFHSDVAASRVHRWTRGDWQLLPILLSPRRYPLKGINQWKIFDNLRRSLVAPASLLLIVLSLSGVGLSPWAALALVIAAFTAGPMMGALAGFSPSRDNVARLHFYRQAMFDLLRAILGGAWHVAQLLEQSLRSADAIGRAVYRTTISRRKLLEWTTADAAQAGVKTRLADLAKQHWRMPVAALIILTLLLMLSTGATTAPHTLFAIVLCLVWGASAVWTWLVSRKNVFNKPVNLPAVQRAYLHDIARGTWRFFERCVVASDNYLPPDNLQTSPHDIVAHRTSPTNIGLYLLSVMSARQFGWIGTQDAIARLEATYSTLLKLDCYRGHFYNWYDTQTLAPLLPLYVSTVDSGNCSGHFLAVAQACKAMARTHHTKDLQEVGIRTSEERIRRLLRKRPSLSPALRDELKWCLQDHRNTLSSHLADAALYNADSAQQAASNKEINMALLALAEKFEKLAWQPDYSFLYHRKRKLFHIGYRLAEHQLDESYYDLLASESRLTSLLAIAKGDVPVAHWAALARPSYAVGTGTGLRSWSGSMFEYAMPTLVLDEPPGSILSEACAAALREQIIFGAAHSVPWGISESAYAAQDHTLAYQYAPQGVPRLALRRTPPDELVVAPYATALAVQMSPHLAIANFVQLDALHTRGRYGFIEALDYTVTRQTESTGFVSIQTFMAHHQAMSIVAIANVLLDGVPRCWAMANPRIQAVASLLHERPPREVSVLALQLPDLGGLLPKQHTPGFLRDVVPSATALEPTHILSNGRYSVSLRANGAGYSKWGSIDINRWRDDALRDAYGSFFYVRWNQQPKAVSITQHPAPDAAAHYSSTYHADRVCFDAVWPKLQIHTTVWVSPEDDIELRKVEISNESDQTIEIELLSAFEVTLSDARADEAHPAFGNLFVRTHWHSATQALVFERTARLATEKGLFAAHFLAVTDRQVTDVRYQTDRQLWLGRNHTASNPVASVKPTDGGTDTGLDPVSVLAVKLRIAAGSVAKLTFATAACDNQATLHAVIDKYRLHNHVQRASLMSATLAGIRNRALGVSTENFAAIQLLTTTLLFSLTRPQTKLSLQYDPLADSCDRRLLWHFGISGDRPLIVVYASVLQGLGLLRAMVQALRMWSWAGVACDMVVINAEPASYLRSLQHEIAALQERFTTDMGSAANPYGATMGFHVMRVEELTGGEISTLRSLARVWLQADGRPLALHVKELCELHEQAFEDRDAIFTTPVAMASSHAGVVPNPVGSFDTATGDFTFDVNAQLRPAKPWINVLANPDFGAHISESGGGYTWAGNSRLNQLTAWSNDAVCDAPSEWFLVQDCKTMDVWSVAPSAWGDNHAQHRTLYQVKHGQGYTTISHQRGDVDIKATWSVDAQTSVKQIQIHLTNKGRRTLHLRLIGMVEWMMGAQRSDRRTVHTALFEQGLAPNAVTALLCTQREMSGGFGAGTGFLAMADHSGDADDWTCDRRECFDARGRLVLPDHFGQHAGSGLDPCAALSVRFELAAGTSTERVFLLGYASTLHAAQQLAVQAAQPSADHRLDQVRSSWNQLLAATTVKTPDPLFDVMVNRWLLYQTVSCRMWAKAGFYQAGGATGYRDQLQDAMALAWAAPHMLRAQIVLGASRQFAQGDVQHWWHAPTGAGVRTHFSDDLLWLPHACHHYVHATGDASLWDQEVPFIEAGPIPDGAEDAYTTPTISSHTASIYEHGARAIDHSLRVGVHGLPLMGSGDWNDGMNRVGHLGRGESVWLAWFLCQQVAQYAPVARQRGDTARAARWEAASLGWQTALMVDAWDGQWFKRAFFDDGQPLGSHANSEARIDLIAQAWAVLSNAAPHALQRIALEAVENSLVNHEAGLIKLLDPPLAHSVPSAGYIQAYPPGVRENGGQYSHGAVWALMAQAEFATRANKLGNGGSTDLAYRYFTYLSPAHRAAHPTHGAVYGIEPYVMAGDVYTHAPYVGRGGWSWYTGSAAWMHRAAIESIFGLRLSAQELSFTPCLPSHWPQAEITLLRDGKKMRFILLRDTPSASLKATAQWAAQPLLVGQTLRWQTLAVDTCFVIALVPESE